MKLSFLLRLSTENIPNLFVPIYSVGWPPLRSAFKVYEGTPKSHWLSGVQPLTTAQIWPRLPHDANFRWKRFKVLWQPNIPSAHTTNCLFSPQSTCIFVSVGHSLRPGQPKYSISTRPSYIFFSTPKLLFIVSCQFFCNSSKLDSQTYQYTPLLHFFVVREETVGNRACSMSHGWTLSRESNRQNGVMPTLVIFTPFCRNRVDSMFWSWLWEEGNHPIIFHSKLRG